MSEEFKKLNRKRGAIKSKLTRFENYITQLKTEFDSNKSLDSDQIFNLELRISKNDELLNEFESIQSEIGYLEVELEQDENKECESFEETYYSCMSIAKRILSCVSKPIVEENVSDAFSHAGSAHSIVNLNNNTNFMRQSVKLPTIELPKFNGDYEKWLEFRDTFLSLIHTNKALEDIQKFHYLRASLVGPASNIIQSLEISTENYSIAWDLVAERFNNNKLLVQNHLKALFNISPLLKESSVGLRQLLDTISKHIRSLTALGQPTEHWDTIIIFLLTNKFDIITAKEWEQFKRDIEVPTLNDMKTFLRCRAELLESLENQFKFSQTKNKNIISKDSHRSFISSSEAKTTNSCSFCKINSHLIYNCANFMKLPVNSRIDEIKKRKLCINCLKPNHFSNKCYSGTCKHCNGKHNSLLHFEPEVKSDVVAVEPSNTTTTSCSSSSASSQVLLSTALINVYDSHGNSHMCTALLDSGSQSNFITESCCNRLGLSKSEVNFSVVGIGQTCSNIRFSCNVKLQSLRNKFHSELSCLVIPKISDSLPSNQIDCSTLTIPKHLRLADPTFHTPKDIDVLLGAGIFWNLMCIGQVNLGKGQPIMQKTQLGWVISGCVSSSKTIRLQCNLNMNLNDQVEKFWKLEDIPNNPLFSKEEMMCESHFAETHTRDANGRFIVSIPLKESVEKLGNSKQNALNRFRSLERKFKSNLDFCERYTAFMTEYESLGHMSVTKAKGDEVTYYLPHHGVFKHESLTTKLRVVFDGSAPSDSGLSFNDLQMVGPTIQNDLLAILLRFRKHAFVITADIEKMYRQVLVNPKFRPLQQIFWRPTPDSEILSYTLNTVTYGTASAPFLAIRCLKQLALESQSVYPTASKIIDQDFYVDDLITGADSVDVAIRTCNEVSAILKSGCFDLRKWSTNNPQILRTLQNSGMLDEHFQFGSENNAKTLGLLWSCKSDTLFYSITTNFCSNSVTKRNILASTAQIFDPLGLISPCTVLAKILLQKLWGLKISWDEAVPQDIYTEWINFRSELCLLNALQIPRHVICLEYSHIQLHGFSDASQSAYGAGIYVRSVNRNGTIYVNLLCAKTRVAPLKSISIPRLELCAALLLSQLYDKVNSTIHIQFDTCHFWTDSTIVLGWLNTSPNLLQTFVGNRVSEIQGLTDIGKWHHVSTKHNPADYLSRGVRPSQLTQDHVWWCGPEWLRKPEVDWPISSVSIQDICLPDLRKQTNIHIALNNYISFPFHRFSKYTRLLRVMAFCKRFLSNCKLPVHFRQSGHLTVKELDAAANSLIKIAQAESFSEEIQQLSQGKPLNSKGSLLSLSPFIDPEGIIRVGGRIQLSKFNFDKKHPILLSSKHHLTIILFQHQHLKLLHAGPQLLLSTIREKFWPISGRNLAKKTVRECVKCFRFTQKPQNPIMGQLPETRVIPMPPFHAVGVDYAGPFAIKDRKGRGSKTSKCYMCLFVCFVTRAIHLELVTNLTSEAFIATFRRFIARRGKPLHVYSDNGTNFVGANQNLRDLGSFLVENSDNLIQYFASEEVTWHFIPAHSPHFGGLWEAGVKSVKHHLKRVMGNSVFTFEDFYTIITQIESILNSRPMTSMSSDPNDLQALTPSHFLIGRLATSAADPRVTHIQENRLSLYQQLQRIKQHFWERWSKEYISELQQRSKWKTNQGSVAVGSLVLVKEDNLPPHKWQLGRVSEVHPGPDSIVRVVSIKTNCGVIKRAVQKVCVLPLA